MAEFDDQNKWFEHLTKQLIDVRLSKGRKPTFPEHDTPSVHSYILVRVGDKLFGIPLDDVQRIAPPLWTHVPLIDELSESVIGVFGHARQIYTVMGLASLLERGRYIEYITQKKLQALLVVKENILPHAPRIALAISQPLGVIYIQEDNGEIGKPFKDHDRIISRDGETIVLVHLAQLLAQFVVSDRRHKGE